MPRGRSAKNLPCTQSQSRADAGQEMEKINAKLKLSQSAGRGSEHPRSAPPASLPPSLPPPSVPSPFTPSPPPLYLSPPLPLTAQPPRYWVLCYVPLFVFVVICRFYEPLCIFNASIPARRCVRNCYDYRFLLNGFLFFLIF